ncbi:MAG: glycosyltransferase [Kiloniellaceae bacterium]
MANIVVAEVGIPFDGRSIERGPLGGVETSVILLAEALAARGHRTTAIVRTDSALEHNGVLWRPPPAERIPNVDLFVASRAPRLFALAHRARREVFWLHGPADYLRKPRHLWPLLRHRPFAVTLSRYHRSTLRRWMPISGESLVALAPEPVFTTAATASAPPGPRAVFLSNPERSLDWLLEIWAAHIRPAVPEAQLHLFVGPQTYGGKWAERMAPVLARARALGAEGVLLRDPLPKPRLADELRRARVMVYRGDPGETFCLAAAAAQAMGVPVVTGGLGALRERVVDGVTGMIAARPDAFAAAAIALLTDDGLWSAQHAAALERRASRTWDDVAAEFEALLA